ncbi:hypothetical protein SAMN05216551_11456 [Chitinasiproducens palmae]|uniref:Uncharacterized protein n=2 Tax=Chitinasiproducens palmae TaxID=1770053 RepID=A0A1H2PUQ4_9BURK|nr:hypothetical protein SAMN05216551_11456 [Chitinasiproducens palmae]
MTMMDRSNCIAILSLAGRLAPDAPPQPLDAAMLGLGRNDLETTAAFLVERGCFMSHRISAREYAVGPLSLQGRLRLQQLCDD